MKISSPPPRAPRSSRAMALMAAIMMFVLIGAAVLSMMMVFAAESRRTRAAINGAQLRQLLLAGALFLRHDLQQHAPTARDIPLTVPLQDATLSIHLTPESGPTSATARIAATYHDAHATQLLTLARNPNNTWTIVSAELHD